MILLQAFSEKDAYDFCLFVSCWSISYAPEIEKLQSNTL